MYEMCLGDNRLNRRANQLIDAIVKKKSVVINQIATCWNDQVAYYRLLKNDRVKLSEL